MVGTINTLFTKYEAVVRSKEAIVLLMVLLLLFFDFSLSVKAASHECVIRTGQP